MPVVIFILFVAAIVWAIVLLRTKVASQLLELKPLPMLAVGIVIVGSVFGFEFFHVSGGPVPITLDRALFGLMLALAAWLWLINKEDLRPINRLDIAMAGLIGILLFSTFTNDYKFQNNLPASRLLFFYLIPLGIYSVARTAQVGAKELKLYSILFGAFAVYLALTGVAEMKQFYAVVFPRYIINSDTVEFLGRGRGPFLNPVSNGMFQIFGLCCIWFWWPRSSTPVRMIIALLSLIVIAGIYATLTRSVWLSLLIVGGIVIWMPSTQKQKGMMVVAATVAIILAFPVIGDKLTSFKRDKEVTESQMSESAQLRPLFLTVALRMFKDRPVFGCGFGQYAREKYPYLQDPYTGKPLSKTKTYMQHNVFLAYLTETGIIGLSVLIALLATMGRMALRLWQDTKRLLYLRQFGLLHGALLACFCVNGMFHDTSIMPMVNVLLFFSAGVVNNITTSQICEEDALQRSRPATTVPNYPSGQRGFPAANS